MLATDFPLVFLTRLEPGHQLLESRNSRHVRGSREHFPIGHIDIFDIKREIGKVCLRIPAEIDIV